MSIPTPVQLRSKLPDVGTTIFSVIGQLSAQHQAVNLSQGAPNFPCDPRLIAGVTQAMEANRNRAGNVKNADCRESRSALWSAI